MSGPVAIGVYGEGTLLSTERTSSFDVSSLIEKANLHGVGNGDLCCTSSSASGFRVEEIVLSNGESYSGTLQGNAPEGSGRYTWADGTVYEGEWRRGMRHGNGKLLFASGAIYEGEFSGGYMHGTGMYSRPGHLIYKGRWRLSLKHGLGYQTYANGDVFEGSWIQGAPEGPGKYTWANGNVYLGNMKGGKMSGKGCLTWTNGDTFEGSWLHGLMDGFGVYTWTDGGCYVGTWTQGLKDGKGAFYPKDCKIPAVQEIYLDALRMRGLLPEMKKMSQVSHMHHAASVDMGNFKVGRPRRGRHHSVDNSNLALDRHWSLEASMEKVIGSDASSALPESVSEVGEKEHGNNSIPILERVYMQGVLISEVVVNNSFSPRRAKRWQKKLAKEVKKPGEAIIKGHRSYDLMLSLQLGIR